MRNNSNFEMEPFKFKSKKNYPTICQNLRDYFTQFTENTTIHGVRYLGERKRNILEKLWWLIVIAVSLYMCIALIIKTYKKWDTSPLIVNFARNPTPIWQIPFPAITICSETKSRQTVFNFTDVYHKIMEDEDNYTLTEFEEFQKVALACDKHFYNNAEETMDYDAIDFLSEVAPPFDEVLWVCKWTNKNETCDSLYTKVLTDEGICYTFNMLDRDDIFRNEVFHYSDFLQHTLENHGWTLETGYSENAEKDTFPRRALSSGRNAGLTMLLRTYTYDLDYICKGPVQGFKIILHHPGEVPMVSSQYIRAPLNQEVVVAIKPEMMTTSEGLRDYDPHRRQCYFSSERYLRFYKNYTQQNCEVECSTNFTLEACGCVAFYMPHDESTPICGTAKFICMANARNDLLALKVEKGISSKKSENANLNIECDCLPACTSLAYNAETSQADFNWPALFQALKSNLSEFPGVQMTRVTFFFKEMQFITSERNELYGLTDFMASCGGLLGLFIGFSFLSLVETFYFLTLRLWCNIKNFGLHYWSGSPDLINNDAYEHDDIKKS